MRVIIITVLLVFIVRAVAENVDIGKANSDAEAYESFEFKKLVTHCSSHVAERCSESGGVDEEGGGKEGAYGLALCLLDSMKRCLVEHGASLKEGAPPIREGPSKDPQLFLPPPINGVPVVLPPPLSSNTVAKPPTLEPLHIETLKFHAVLRTCSYVSARTCFTHLNNLASSLLSACLIPSMNQCVYPRDSPGEPPLLP